MATNERSTLGEEAAATVCLVIQKKKRPTICFLSFRKRKVFRIWGTGSKVRSLISPTYSPESWRRSEKVFEATRLNQLQGSHTHWAILVRDDKNDLLTRETQKKKREEEPKKKGRNKNPKKQKPQKENRLKTPPTHCPATHSFFQELFSTEDD